MISEVIVETGKRRRQRKPRTATAGRSSRRPGGGIRRPGDGVRRPRDGAKRTGVGKIRTNLWMHPSYAHDIM